MSKTEGIKKHESRIEALAVKLDSTRTNLSCLETRAAELRNWLKGQPLSADALEARGRTLEHASKTSELEGLTGVVSDARQQVASLEKELEALKATKFASADILEDRKNSYRAVLGEWNEAGATEKTLLSQREQASQESADNKRALTVAEGKQRQALSMGEVSAAGKDVTAAAQKKADADALVCNIDSALVRLGKHKDDVRKRLATAEKELWRAQSAALVESLLGEVWFADCKGRLTAAYAASVRAGDAFDFGRFLASVALGGELVDMQAEQAAHVLSLGIVEGITR